MSFEILSQHDRVIVRCKYQSDRNLFLDALKTYYPDINFKIRDNGEELK